MKEILLFFPLNPVPFNGQSYQKQKESGTSEQSLNAESVEKGKITKIWIFRERKELFRWNKKNS